MATADRSQQLSATAATMIRRARAGLKPAKAMIHRVAPARVARVKYEAELAYWRGELRNLDAWFHRGTVDWWGVPPPSEGERYRSSDLWSTNAVLTLHHLRPTYHEELQLDGNAFSGERILEVGAGPLVPVLQFSDCERHAVDPLADRYTAAGWPLFDYDVKVLNARGERMPYPERYFDAVIAVNSLDHVDDFSAVTREIQRVLRPGGRLCFEVEYHEPTVTEPLRLDDESIRLAFTETDLEKVLERDASDLYDALSHRFGLVSSKFRDIHSGDELFTTWHGVRR